MVWAVQVHRHGTEPSRTYQVRARSRDAAVRKLAALLDVPAWTIQGSRA